MTIPIPSWFVAILGTLVTMVSTLVLTLVIDYRTGRIDELGRRIGANELVFQRRHQTTRQGDGNSITAHLFAGLHSLERRGTVSKFVAAKMASYGVETVRSYCQARIQDGSCGTVLAKRETGSGEKQPERRNRIEVIKEAERLGTQVAGGDFASFDKMVRLANQEHLEASLWLNELREEITVMNGDLRARRGKLALCRLLAALLALVGLILVLLKDLPIWRDRRIGKSGGL